MEIDRHDLTDASGVHWQLYLALLAAGSCYSLPQLEGNHKLLAAAIPASTQTSKAQKWQIATVIAQHISRTQEPCGLIRPDWTIGKHGWLHSCFAAP